MEVRMNHFSFIEHEWPDSHNAASKAESLTELDALFASLQHRAFKGQL